MRSRLLVVGGVLAILAILPLWKLIEVQAADGSRLAAKGSESRSRTVPIHPVRGAILDRNGVELAMSLPRLSIGVDKAVLLTEEENSPAAMESFAHRLAELFDVDADGLAERLKSAPKSSPWVQVANGVEERDAKRAIAEIERTGIVGAVVTGPSSARIYPAGEMAKRVLGTLRPDGEPVSTRAGIEAAYDDELSGKPGEIVVERGRTGATVPGTQQVTVDPVDGSDVVLTLDRSLQYEACEITRRGVDESGARRGIAILGVPGTGEILAVCSFERDDDDGTIRPTARPAPFSDAFQAGSVFKVVTVAAALEAGIVDEVQTLTVPDTIVVGPKRFTDHTPHDTEQMQVKDIVARSSNVGTILIAQELGKERLRQGLLDFGFGTLTGVGHPAEQAGIVPPLAEWMPTDLAASAIGTHQAGTAVQLWSAYNVIANDGLYIQPRLVDSVIAPDGTRRRVESLPPRRVVSAETAAKIGPMLREVVTGGTASMWDILGYDIAAKTGTSRLPRPDQENTGPDGDPYRWADGDYHGLAAFAGYLPADRPEVSITVILEDLEDHMTGSSAAGPVFSELAKLAIRELGIAPSLLVGGAGSPGEAGSGKVRAEPAPAAVRSEDASDEERVDPGR